MAQYYKCISSIETPSSPNDGSFCETDTELGSTTSINKNNVWRHTRVLEIQMQGTITKEGKPHCSLTNLKSEREKWPLSRGHIHTSKSWDIPASSLATSISVTTRVFQNARNFFRVKASCINRHSSQNLSPRCDVDSETRWRQMKACKNESNGFKHCP